MEIPIAQDIRKYKTKGIGNFSFAEAGFLALGFGAGFLTYKLTNDYETAILPAGLIIAFGFFKPFGMSIPQFLNTVIKESMLTPRVYINESDFEYDTEDADFEKFQRENINDGVNKLNKIIADEEEYYGEDLSDKKLQPIEDGEQVPISAEWDVIQTTAPVKYTKEEKARILT